ncbi:bifunctional SulP family inorganic anion transporter/carbonic anhydrase [Massilia forsythiae]|uniref:Bifunctional SulP family inorganic anion transporter/carbonic anhydrase n=1 Tax=Massilia forsythiae TaxID=2728020 RepID=A0A7Z2ZR66_9BURK|nr:SulP family inorganic anion transporter [Massilia forsythiae]QJD98794.1 bifunctional SulP family inorganic anion transporter/carbonic anhydrase [Massilia forsythiae]
MNTQTLKYDVPAGIVVFLVALPLCLGIALASGAPLFSGVISGIIGGIVVGMASGSQTSVSGPAAGLAAVVLASITKLGAFDILLVAVLIAGFLQLAMGLMRAGFIANYVPSNVIKGLLAAIGILLILKQIPHAIGYDSNGDDASFAQANGENTFSVIANAFSMITPGAVVITAASLLVLLYWDRTPLKNVKLLPAPLFVVAMGILLNLAFNNFFPALQIEPAHLVDIPPIDTNNLGAYVQLPDLAHLANPDVWMVGFTIAIVASLETLLNIEAVDKIDPHKRETPPNRELLAQGVGNICAGFLGGLPVTSVIVRSSVNIQNDNRTKVSAVLHGILLLVSVVALSPLINMIPLSALAAILIVTGYKLTKTSLFRDMYLKGWSQFAPFIITILAIVFTDLLKGVLIGLAASLFFLLRSNFRNPFSIEQYRLHIGDVIKMELPNQVSFLNKATIKTALWEVPDGAKVLIDASNADYIDNDVLETIEDFRVSAAERNVRLNVIGLRDKYQMQDPIQFVPALDKETQNKLRPAEILQLLRDGNERFRSGRWTKKYYEQQVDATATGQHPMAVVVNCIDSRTSPEIIFDAGLGDLLTIRIAGNVISREIIGSLEIAHKLGAKLIVVKGHSSCGAVGLALQDEHAHSVEAITGKIRRAVAQCGCGSAHGAAPDKAALERVTRQNIQNSLADIIDGSEFLRGCVARGEMGLVGAYHDIAARTVDFGTPVTGADIARRHPSAAGAAA